MIYGNKVIHADGTSAKVITAVGYTDLPRGIEGLATTIKSKYHLDPHEKNVLFLFCGSHSDRIKGLLWEGDGFLPLYKRLDVGFLLLAKEGLHMDLCARLNRSQSGEQRKSAD